MAQRGACLPVLLFLLACVPRAAAQEPQVAASFGAGGRVAADETFILTLSRSLTPDEGRLAVFVGATDWTSQFEPGATVLRFTPRSLRLPEGRSELIVYRVTPAGDWHVAARLPLEVLPAGAFRTASLQPSLDLALKAQLAEGHEPADNVPLRATFQDLTAQIGLKTQHARRSFALATGVKLIGVSHRPEALRFGTLGEEAPRLDLAGYTVDLRQGAFGLRLGDLTWGQHRHLAKDFGTRGLSARLDLGRVADLTLSAAAGSKLVGWDNPLGVDTAEHRLLSATLGLELLPARPGGVRLETSLLHGAVLPLANYNQGLVNDAAESDGFGLRLLASDARRRVTLDAGYARSHYVNPQDPLLEQGESLVAVAPETAGARYVDLRVDLLQGRPALGRDLTLSASVLHERVDPLYGSVGARVSPNRQSNTFGAALRLGQAVLQYSHGRALDNLENLQNVLTTQTRQDTLNLSLPFSSFQSPDAEPSPFLPVLTYQWSGVHQFGERLPVDSGFNPSHVPDQSNRTHTGNLAWTGNKVALTYDLSHNRQDNRQPGRENADFESRVQTVSLQLFPSAAFDALLDFALERNEALQRNELQRLRRLGGGFGWRPGAGFGLSALLSHTQDESDSLGSEATTLEADLQASWRREFRSGRKQPAATLYLRWARQRARLLDALAELNDERASWQLSAGLNLSAF